MYQSQESPAQFLVAYGNEAKLFDEMAATFLLFTPFGLLCIVKDGCQAGITAATVSSHSASKRSTSGRASPVDANAMSPVIGANAIRRNGLLFALRQQLMGRHTGGILHFGSASDGSRHHTPRASATKTAVEAEAAPEPVPVAEIPTLKGVTESCYKTRHTTAPYR